MTTTDKNNKERTSICLNPDLLTWTRKQAHNSNLSVSQLIANALEAYKAVVEVTYSLEETKKKFEDNSCKEEDYIIMNKVANG